MPIFFTVRDQIFNITVYGLKPLTVHTCYFERNKVDANKLKPKNGQLGNQLITDANGSLTFDFYYSSGLGDEATELNQAQKQAANIAGLKELIVTDTSVASLPANYEDTASSLFVGQINVSVYIPPESEWTTPVVEGGGGGRPWYKTFLCTLMYNAGFLNDTLWEADGRYGLKVRMTDPNVYDGYQIWAEPLAKWIEDGLSQEKISAKITLNMLKPFVVSWAEYMAYEQGLHDKFNILGFAVMKAGYPVCKLIGSVRNTFFKQSSQMA